LAENEYNYRLMVDELISATIVNSSNTSNDKEYFRGIPVSKYDKVTG